MCTRKPFRSASMLVLFGLLGSTSVIAADLAEALTAGEASLNLRYRLELVEDDRFSEDAEASTLRVRLNYLTDSWNQWQGMIEFDHVMEVGLDDFNSGAGTSSLNRAVYPVVADPDGSDLNQLWLRRSFGDDGQFTIGRQRILLDNQRFVGGVGWRQNEQTYDSASVRTTMGGGSLFYAYVTNINRIFGNDVPAGDHDHNSHLIHASWPIGEIGSLTTYGYLLDNDDAPSLSSDTLGVRWSGKFDLQQREIHYLLEFAHQSDSADNPADYSANYYRLQGQVPAGPVQLLGGVEVLEGDADQAFQTPLATLHAFNGWADQFLATPVNGLQDVFVGASGKWQRYGWQLIAHDFESEIGSDDFGSEIDASIAWKYGKESRYGLLVKAAFFDGDNGRADVNKLWFMWQAGF